MSNETSILIRTYKGDFDWLPYCLRSIKKFARGFDEIFVITPEQDLPFLKQFSVNGEVLIGVPERLPGYIAQQYDKLHADVHVDSPFVLHFDSDCVFTQPVTPESFFRDGKPMLLYTPYSELGDAVPWKPIVEKALEFTVENEYMRRLPIVYPWAVYSQLRNYMGSLHQKDLFQYLGEQPHHAFSEFNVLGAFCHKFYADHLTFVNTQNEVPPALAKQYWSWGRVSAITRANMEEILK